MKRNFGQISEFTDSCYNFYLSIKSYQKNYGSYKMILFVLLSFYSSLRTTFLQVNHELDKSHIVHVNDYDLCTIPNDRGISAELQIFKTHEPIATELLKKELKYGMVCFDIGSNIGYYAILERKKVGKAGKVLCFEPSRLAYSYLKRNLSINNYADVETSNIALTSNDTLLDFGVSEKSNWSRVIDSAAVFTGETIKVPGRSVDSIVVDFHISKIDLIRMDVEGHEFEIYKGCKSTIDKFKPMILVEFHLAILGFEKSRILLELLKNDGYCVRYFIQRELEPLEFLGVASKKEVYSSLDLEQLLCFLKQGKLPPFFTLLLVNMAVNQ